MERVWIVNISLMICWLVMCFLKGFERVVYFLILIIVRVRDEDVEKVVCNGYKSLYIVFLKSYV